MKKTPKLKLGLPFTAVTAVYLLISLFGCLLYILLPPFLCSIGARIHAYLLIAAATEEQATFGQNALMVIAHLYVLAMLFFGVLALVKGWVRPYCILVALEIVLTLVFLLVQSSNAYDHPAGIVVNIAYCVWLFRIAFRKKPRRVHKKSKVERKSTDGKL